MGATRRAARAVVAVSCLALTACSVGAPSGGPTEPPEDVDISAYSDVHAVLDRSAESIVYPIDAFFISRADLGRLAQANALLWDDCMREGGRTYPPAEFDLTQSVDAPDTAFGIWSPDSADRFGYALDPSLDDDIETANAALMAASQADPGWDAAFDACLESVERLPELGRDFAWETPQISDLPQSIRNDAGMLASTDPVWEDARQAWSDCLVSRGLTLDTEVEGSWAPEIPEDPEAAIRTAVLDVQCKEETGLVETLSSLHAQYQAALIDRHRAALDEVAEKEREIVAHADEIIATRGAGG
ncbi:hypothetical protein SAMN06295885_2639 [Rathayibacter oskolensis]|uniref:Uncharacterized protein n=1 Tax=Rathayibacter oskolensis TaxID=1891671 RepID=A0A1X7P6H2_9MICO|nr:hypothetical protein [Rathayibacter oskolensis]SMH45854.1 hypothetical protein SAMN06295885_2639 [Rathayibacter oskolensis]